METSSLAPAQRVKINWRDLRKALGLSSAQMAAVLCMTRVGYVQLELSYHTGPPKRQTLMMLRLWLQSPALVERLRMAKYPHPFPEDLEPGAMLTPTVEAE